MSSGGIRRRFTLALLSFALALGVSEFVLRVAEAEPTDGLRGLHEARPGRPWLYGLRPGARGTLAISGEVVYEVNREGFRDRLYARPKPPDTFRILVLGDSLSFGYGVARWETFSDLIEAELGSAAEVLNFGVGGYNPYNEATLFREVGLSYEPDLVLVQFCTNDLTDPTLHFDAHTLLHLGSIPDEAFPNPDQRVPRASGWLVSLLGLCRQSQLCARIDDAWIRWSAAEPDPSRALAALRSPDSLPPGPEREWLAGRYGEIAADAARIGARLAVVVFPFRAQLEGDASDRLQLQLTRLGVERGWETVDLLPGFRAARAAEGDPLFRDLWHPNAAGHRVAARVIVDELNRRGLLPDPQRG